MAKIRMQGFDDVIRNLTSLDVDHMTEEMIGAAEPVMIKNLKAWSANHYADGDMYNSIKSTGVKKNNKGKYLVVRPTGKDKDGVRNMEKMAYLEYGTAHQRATPVLTPAVKESEPVINHKMDEIFDRYLKKVSI